MAKLTENEKKCLAIAYNRKGITKQDTLTIFRSIQYGSEILKRMHLLGYLKLDYGNFAITQQGKDVLNLNQNKLRF